MNLDAFEYLCIVTTIQWMISSLTYIYSVGDIYIKIKTSENKFALQSKSIVSM